MHRHQGAAHHDERVIPTQTVEHVAVTQPNGVSKDEISTNSHCEIEDSCERSGDVDGCHHSGFGAPFQLTIVEGNVVVACEGHRHEWERNEEVFEVEIEEFDSRMNETVVKQRNGRE